MPNVTVPEVVGLTGGVLPVLLNLDVPPPDLLVLRQLDLESPGGSGLVERLIVLVVHESGPVDAVLGDLELPGPEGGAAVPPRVPQRVRGGQEPHAQVDGEPRPPGVCSIVPFRVH